MSDEHSAASSLRCPSENQYRTLLALGSGSMLLTGTKGKIGPLLRHGWVTTSGDGYALARITAAGLHALARAVEKYGLPEMKRGTVTRTVCSECGCDWNPRCRCGSRLYRYAHEEVELDAAA